MNAVEIFSSLFEPSLFDREFGPQHVAPSADFLRGKRKLHFKPPRGQSYGPPPKRRGDRESDKARDQKPQHEDHCLFNHIPPRFDALEQHHNPFTTNLCTPQIPSRTGTGKTARLRGNCRHDPYFSDGLFSLIPICYRFLDKIMRHLKMAKTRKDRPHGLGQFRCRQRIGLV
jgi:hypothetical protein